MMIPFWGGASGNGRVIPIPPELPPFWTPARDVVLRSTVYNEAFWAGAIGIAITKMASKAWEVESEISIRARRGQDLLLQADGRAVGYTSFLAKHLRDYLTTDNGSFIEIVRATSSAGSRIVGLRHLDSLRVLRTGDPEVPVIYRDRKGRYHQLKSYQVIALSDMPDPSETYYGVGQCAADRAYNAIYKLAAIEWYLREKVSGQHPLAIYIVNGILSNQLTGAVAAAKEDELAKGVAAYMGAVIVGVPSETQANLVTIPLAELPDRFNRKEEFDIAALTYANAIGLDPQDLQPLTGQSLGSGAQSQVLDDKTRGKGLSMWAQDFTHAMNEYVFDDMTTFHFVEDDYRDKERNAQVSKLMAEVGKLRVDAGITTAAEEKQVLVDKNELPKEFLSDDMTPGETLDDTEKPDVETEDEPEAETDTPNVWGAKEHTGVMVGFFLSEFQAGQLGKTVQDNLHLTLAMLPNADGVFDKLTAFAKTHLPIVGKTNGTATFQNDTIANVLLFDAPELAEFRQDLVEALGVKDTEHGYIPHITLSYGAQPELPVPNTDLMFNEITLAVGDDRITLPLTGTGAVMDDALVLAETNYAKYAIAKELQWNLKN
jgi:hypothetical protein